jgi:putative phosphoesterase
MNQMTMVVGIISDTHGLLRPEAVDALSGCDLILHAGDIGKPEVLKPLKLIAPLYAVRGNNDIGDWAEKIPEDRTVKAGSINIYMIHDIKEMAIDPKKKRINAVISGHSHKPSIQDKDGVLFINPGSAGPRRFKLPVAVAILKISQANIEAKIVELKV